MSTIRSRSDYDVTVEESPTRNRNQFSPPPLYQSYDDSRAPWLCFIFNLMCTLLHGYSVYFLNFNRTAILLNTVYEPSLQSYGLWKLLTYYSLIFQFISSLTHLVVYFFPKYRIIRDIIFTSIAFPIGNLVAYSFWAVWMTQGRDMIYPKLIEAYYPMWLNHVSHTLVVPLNIFRTYLTLHRFIKLGYSLSLGLILIYGLFLLFIRWRDGIFVYPYINQMGVMSIIVYFGSILFSSLALYEIGYFLTAVFHLKKLRGIEVG